MVNDGSPSMGVMLVCRANRARSPVTAMVLRNYANQHRIRPEPRIDSSGLYAEEGQALLPEIVPALKRQGFQAFEHTARRFHAGEALDTDLVITFERQLLRTIIERDPDLMPISFTMREVLRLSRSPLWDPAWNGRPGLAARLHRLRPRVPPGQDDTPDPVGVPARVRRRLVEDVIADAESLAAVVLGDGHSGLAP